MKASALLLILCSVFFACQNDTTPPEVVATVPATGTQEVDPSVDELTVTFNEAMKDGNWSWAYTSKDRFPEMTGQPFYRNDRKTNVLPVKLEPNREYEIWINSETFTNFQDRAGNPLPPYRLVFKTGDAR